MLTPYEFGAAVGSMTKQSRGLIADMALYSNPWTGLPTAAWDAGHNLYNGKPLAALGSVASGALSLVGGGLFGGAARAAGGAAASAAKGIGAGLVRNGVPTLGKAIAKAPRVLQGLHSAARAPVRLAQRQMTRGLSRVLPVRPVQSMLANPVQAGVNYVARNPLDVMTFAHSPAGS